MKATWFCLCLLLSFSVNSQPLQDEQNNFSKISRDSNGVKIILDEATLYYFTKPDSCLILSGKALNLAKEINFKPGEVSALTYMSESSRFLGDYPGAIKLNLEALQLSREMKDSFGVASSLGFLGLDYVEFKEYRQGLIYLFEASKLNHILRNQVKEVFAITNIGNAYDCLQITDSALFYGQLALKRYEGLNYGPLKSLILTRVGKAFAALKNGDSALYYYRAALINVDKTNDGVNSSKVRREIAEFYEDKGEYDSSLFYAREAAKRSLLSAQRLELLETSKLLSRLFRRAHSSDSALYYQDIEKAMTDSLYGYPKFKQLQLLMLDEQQKQQLVLDQQRQYKTRTKMVGLLSAVGVLLILGILLFRNNRHKQKAKLHIEKAYEELKNTQKQLIQSEKMASLGELTAGIAHEIQNPLNFVNNFSELNGELISDMRSELNAGKIENAIKISNDIESNENKILEHGKRADSIVKSMLQHTRTGTGKKEEVDINVLTEEHVRLAYHGWKAKDKSFNTKLETHFDKSVPKIQVVPQDIGRVILNLVNNAFYAVSENQPESEKDKVPTVWVETKNAGSNIEIIVKDNGKGIPKEVVEKIFQPFFTTKPAGKGTGLGLSLSYDIVKAHNGDIQVKSELGEGVEFIISLPIQ